MRVRGIDHYVIISPDPERAIAWYRERLGLEPVRLDQWRRGEVPFASLRIDAGLIVDILEGERSGENIAHVALMLEDVVLEDLAESGDFDVVLAPVPLFGARGEGSGMYVRDPDGNLVELRTYPAAPT